MSLRTNISLMALTSAMGIFSAPMPVHAATFNVTDTAGLSAALTDAQNNDQDDVINIAAGEYDASAATFTYIPDNTGGSEEKFDLELVGADRATTILDGGDLKQILLIRTKNLSGGEDGIKITVRNLTLRNGKADAAETIGGGLFVDSSESDVLVDNCLFKDNFAGNFSGGAELTAELGSSTLSNSIFIGNTANSDAGGAEVFANVKVTAINNVFFDNHATAGVGGGALIQFNFGDGAGERLTVVNNTFLSNTAGSNGGGAYVAMGNGDPERMDVFNNIIFGNTAAADGDDLYVEDTISAVLGGTVLISNNDIGETFLECANLGGCVSNVTEQSNLGVDPQLIDPANGNFHLASDSPMIDKGSADAPELPAKDFEGDPREQGAAPDIGADETVLCGDGTEGPGEECDDGNIADGDGCSAECLDEADGGGGGDAGGCSLVR